ncbi:hypothetical protein [Clostridium botulinum]|uniref:Uncharacterized protein n=1 Tax=Clostridium botulinum CFSAN001627 TaxID=1232189 RepID=M1ZT63_CLOBO|nr:hypothetical protein [Clostridium botulinum]EKN42997.1 hypothetical protein CFSAN001627_03730 [Clostridium botulinum CFSAN001627]MBY6850378.1 hypothetical protein [Clostridium botulinum]MBY6857438.1 hypothetical protein [Clostridium botulinum]MBY6967408.1 hypothetical protein [Clostridium botulinum]
MRIIDMNGKECPKDLEWGQEKYWQDRLMEIWSNHGVKGIAPTNEIESVHVGNASYPLNEIILKDGKKFYDELNSPSWAYEENQKMLNLL